MPDLNMFVISGTVANDPELSKTDSGAVYCDVEVSSSSSWRDREGHSHRREDKVKVRAWGSKAEYCAERICQGDIVFITGRFRSSTWRDASGEEREFSRPILEEVKVFSTRKIPTAKDDIFPL